MTHRARYAVAAAAVLALLGLAALFSRTLLRLAVATGASLATGYNISLGDLRFDRSHLALVDLHVRHGRDPVLDVARIDVTFRLHDLFRPGRRLLGLASVSVDAPQITIVRHKDQSLNINIPHGGAGGPPPQVPWLFTARVRDGTLTVRDPYNPSPQAHLLRVAGIDVDATVSSDHLTRYRVRMDVLQPRPGGGMRAFPVTAGGTVDQDRGFALHRIQARSVPVAGFVDYVVDSPAARFEAGLVHDVDVRLFALNFSPKNPQPYHLGGTVRVEGVDARVVGLDSPVRDLSGRLYLSDGGILAQRIDAKIQGSPIVTSGGFFDFERPQLRIAVRGAADLTTLRSLFTFLRDQPVAGPVRFTTLIEGGVANPLIFAHVNLPHVSWGAFPFYDGAGTVAYYDNAVTMVPLEAHYGPLDVRVRGQLALSSHVDSEFAVRLHGPGRAIPYLDRVAPDIEMEAIGVAGGRDLPLHGRGLLYDGGSGTTLSAFLSVDEHGRGEFGPIDFSRPGGSTFSGSFTLDRPHSESAFWGWAQHFRLTDPAHPATLPGVVLPDFPHLGGVIDGAFAGGGHPSDFTVAGHAQGVDLEFAGIPVSRGSAGFGGTFHELALGPIEATGPWGHITGRGAVAIPGPFFLRGAYDGTLEGLQRFTGDLGAHGRAAGAFALAVDGERILIQARHVALAGATIHGVPLTRFDGTLAIEPGGRLDVFGAEAGLAGATLVAAGGGPGGISVATTGVPAASLAGAGVPLEAGTLTLAGHGGVSGGLPSFTGGVALQRGAYGSVPIALTSALDIAGGSVGVRAATVAVDGAVGMIDGSLGELAAGAPSYDLTAHVPAADLGSLGRTFHLPLPYLNGTLDADLRVGGSGAQPQIAGLVAIPDGSVNGLRFAKARAQVASGAGGISVRNGSVDFGSTRVALSGATLGGGLMLNLRSSAVNLADFNGFFDEGDTLAGRGEVALGYRSARAGTSTTGRVALDDVAYRRFPIGRVDTTWSSGGGVANLNLAMGGTTGSLSVGGTVRLGRGSDLLRTAGFNLRAHVAGMDLGTWLPTLGYRLPVLGRLDVESTLRGTFARPLVSAQATLTEARIDRIPINRAMLAFDASGDRIALRNLAIDVNHLALTGDGTLGLSEGAPLDLTLHAQTDNVGALADYAVHLPFPLTGAVTTDVHVEGTRALPALSGTFTLAQGSAAGLAMPHANGAFALRGRGLEVHDAEIDLKKGALVLGGSLPMTLRPFGIGPAGSPLRFDVEARGVDLSSFAPLAPKGSTLEGMLDGRLGVGGTTTTPLLDGSLALTGGSFSDPATGTRLKSLGGLLELHDQTATLDRLHADVGGGTVDASGRIAFPAAGGPTYRFDLTANRATASIPGFFSGQLDGGVTIARGAGGKPLIGGNVTVTNAVVPFAAFFAAGAASGSASFLPADLAFDLSITAGHNVRVRSGNLDLGGEGTVALTGTLGAPQLSGGFQASPGGTLTYFNRVFRVVQGSVAFQPQSGLAPVLEAEASTLVPNTDPDPVRNPSGSSDITINVSGPVTGLGIDLSSSPYPYSREQILGLLLGASSIGAVNFGGTGQNPTTAGGSLPGAPQVTISGLPPGLVAQQNGTLTVSQQAFGLLNAQFTRGLLSPIENALNGAFGLTTLDLTLVNGGSVGFAARKQLAKNVYAIYGQSFSYPVRQTYGIQAQPSPGLSFQFAGYSQYGLAPFGDNPQSTFVTNQNATAGQPPGGTSGFTFSMQRLLP